MSLDSRWYEYTVCTHTVYSYTLHTHTVYGHCTFHSHIPTVEREPWGAEDKPLCKLPFSPSSAHADKAIAWIKLQHSREIDVILPPQGGSIAFKRLL